MPVVVRVITEEEFDAWCAGLNTGFLHRGSPEANEARRPSMDFARLRGAFEGDVVVGTLRSFATELTVPGGAFVPVSALTAVTVTATHRRQGLLTRMIEPDLHDSADRGEVASILIAAEYPIYGRFGYGPAADLVNLNVDARAARFEDRRPGSVQIGDLAMLRKEGPALYERLRAGQPGAIRRDERWWDLACEVVPSPNAEEGPFKGFIALGRDEAGQPDGYARYSIERKWGDDRRPQAVLTIHELVSTTPAAYERLWRYCCEVDWVAKVIAEDQSRDDLLRWLLHDARAITATFAMDFLWVRPLDLPALLQARHYLTPGSVVFEVVDPLGFASGRYRLEAGEDGAIVAAPHGRRPGSPSRSTCSAPCPSVVGRCGCSPPPAASRCTTSAASPSPT